MVAKNLRNRKLTLYCYVYCRQVKYVLPLMMPYFIWYATNAKSTL